MNIDAMTLPLRMTLGWLPCRSVGPGRGSLQESRNEDGRECGAPEQGGCGAIAHLSGRKTACGAHSFTRQGCAAAQAGPAGVVRQCRRYAVRDGGPGGQQWRAECLLR